MLLTDLNPGLSLVNFEPSVIASLIPRDDTLLHMDRFEDCIKARPALLLETFKPLLVQNS
jgi:hypothetical protein